MLEMLHRFNPEDIVVVCQEGELKRWQFQKLVSLLVIRFKQLQLEPGARVLIVLPNSLELLVSYYACMAAGLIAVPVNERLAKADISRVFSHAEPELIISLSELSSRMEFVSTYPDCRVECLENLQERLIDDVHAPSLKDKWPDQHNAAIFYTSGSTGEPKGVVYSHKAIREYSRMLRTRFGLNESDRSVICHCLAQNFGFTQLSVPFLDCGGSVHIVDFGDAAQTASALASGVSFLRLVPWFAPGLLEYCQEHETQAPRLRNIIIGGDRVQKSIFTSCREVLGIEAAEMFGLVETNTFCVNPLEATDLKTGSIGLPLPGIELVIKNEAGQQLRAGEIGEIWVKTPALMKEYWRDKRRTESFIRDGWVATGDAAHLDEDGYVWFNARIKNIIIHDGDNIYPSELEREISHFPAVREVVIVGIPDKVHGECVGAAIVTNADMDLDMQNFQRFLRDKLAETKIPRHLLVVNELPQTKVGKNDRDAVKVLLMNTATPHHP